MVFGRHTGIDFDPKLGVGGKPKALPKVHGQVFQLGRGQVSRRAAPVVQLHHGTGSIQPLGNPIDLPFQLLEIGNRDLVVLVYDNVAAAEEAQAPAERQMNIDRQWPERSLVVRLADHTVMIRGAECIHPLRRGRVACVSRARNIVPVDHLLGNIEDPASRPGL
jgi:hypothetical protein